MLLLEEHILTLKILELNLKLSFVFRLLRRLSSKLTVISEYLVHVTLVSLLLNGNLQFEFLY